MSLIPPIRRILILSANPKDTGRLRLDAEVREIEEGLKRSAGRDRTEVAIALLSRSLHYI